MCGRFTNRFSSVKLYREKGINMIEELLEKPAWVIDILPHQVPKVRSGQYFAIEDYLLKEPHYTNIRKQMFHILLKLNCYEQFDVVKDDQKIINPAPGELWEMMKEDLNIITCDSLITVHRDDLYMTIYSDEKDLKVLLTQLADSEGMFFRKAA